MIEDVDRCTGLTPVSAHDPKAALTQRDRRRLNRLLFADLAAPRLLEEDALVEALVARAYVELEDLDCHEAAKDKDEADDDRDDPCILHHRARDARIWKRRSR